MEDIRDYHWRYIADDGDNNKNIHDLRWDVYIKDN